MVYSPVLRHSLVKVESINDYGYARYICSKSRNRGFIMAER
jgi:hypothetical protein